LNSPLFKNQALKEEIENEWKSYKPEQFAANKDFDPDALLGKIINMVKGNHMDEINRDTEKKEGKYNMVASSTGGGGGNTNVGGGGGDKKPEEQLTTVELKQAQRYGMTAKEWIDQRTAMEEEEQTVLSGK
jgi:hypothetical protein